jgi:hypothetical protein
LRLVLTHSSFLEEIACLTFGFPRHSRYSKDNACSDTSMGKRIFAVVRESIVLGGPKGVMRLISSVEQLETR